MGNASGSTATQMCDELVDNQIRDTPVLLYSTTVCAYCVRAKRLLADHGVDYVSIELNRVRPMRAATGDELDQRQMAAALRRRTGAGTVPQIFICGEHVGGFNELYELQQSGDLRSRVEQCSTASAAGYRR